jgi:hypothetical protein
VIQQWHQKPIEYCPQGRNCDEKAQGIRLSRFGKLSHILLLVAANRCLKFSQQDNFVRTHFTQSIFIARFVTADGQYGFNKYTDWLFSKAICGIIEGDWKELVILL